MNFISQQMRAMDRMFERMMEEFDAATPLKAIDKAFPKKGTKIKMYRPVLTEYEYKKCSECGTLHLVETESENEASSEKSEAE